MTASHDLPFAEDDLVVFLGHADDANDHAAAVRARLEREIPKELARLRGVARRDLRWRELKLFDWPEDTVGKIGDQGTVVDPWVERADIAVFVFRWRVGKVTWDTELEAVRTRGGDTLVLCAFPDDLPPREIQKDRRGSAAWAELLERKASLTEGYATGGARSTVALPDYTDAAHLADLVAEQVRDHVARHAAGRPAVRIAAFEVGLYARRMAQKYGRLDLEALVPTDRDDGIQLRLPEVFVEPAVRADRPPPELPKELLRALHDQGDLERSEVHALELEQLEQLRSRWMERPALPLFDALAQASAGVVLLGDPGSGKSTLTRYLALSLVDDGADPRARAAFPGAVPLLIELREYAARCGEPGCRDLLGFLATVGGTQRLGFDAASLQGLLASDTPVLLVLDGLDEIFDAGRRAEVVQQIVGLATEHPRLRILVTSRILGYRAEALQDAGFAHHTVQDLDPERMERFARGWFARVLRDRPDDADRAVKRILDAVERSPSIRSLAGNPMLLTIMAIIGRHQELPRERAALYEHAASVLVQHWDVQKRLAEEQLGSDLLEKRDKHAILRAVAWRMQARPRGLAGNSIGGAELLEVVREYLTGTLGLSPERALAVGRAVVAQLRERNFLLCRYGGEVYGFVHRSFLEHFCAAAVLHRFKETHELDEAGLVREVYGRHWAEPAWAEVLRLVTGQLDPAIAGRMIGFLTEEAQPRWVEDGASPTHLLRAVQCLGEVDAGVALEEVGATLLGRVLEAIEHVHRLVATVHERGALRALMAAHTPVKEIRALARELGNRWPGRERHLDWFMSARRREHPHFDLAAALFPRDDRIRTMLEDEVRSGSPLAGWALTRCAGGDPEAAVALLKHRVAQASEALSNSRSLAVRVVASLAHGSDATLEWLRYLLAEDPGAAVRIAAIETLGWKLLTPDVALLREAAVSDPEAEVRERAVYSLREALRGDPSLAELFRDRVTSDPSPAVRGTAATSLLASAALNGITIALSRDLDESAPYLDPWLPLDPDRLEAARAKAQLSEAQLQAELARAEELLGWDLRAGYPRRGG